MGKNRLEAFSDGVIAIIITIMVLELKVPHGASLAALVELTPVFLGYVLSFVYVGIYWNNHHHMLHASARVNGKVLWANLHLLFWLSLIPFTTTWVGENVMAPLPVALYGVVLFFAAVAYYVLEKCLISCNPNDHILANAVGKEYKGAVSVVLYLLAIPLAYLHVCAAYALYIICAMVWFLPDRRIEAQMRS